MHDKNTSTSLLRTKLHRPRLPWNYFHRQHLQDRLDRSLQRPLTLVSAPAGYGKSSLLAHWLEVCDIPNGWISLDKDDNNLYLFLSYFLGAVHTLFPGAVQKTEALLNSPQLLPTKVLSRSLINELDQIDHFFILVLDDYHVISEKAVHSVISEFLQHPPASLHLVISSRFDPPFPLARFRARSQMDEIRIRELRFSSEEIGVFLERLLDTPVDSLVTDALEEKTEGWVTGLRLAVLSMQNRSDLESIVTSLPAESRYVTDYLLAEVLSNQPREIQDYLLATSILDRFCAPLCDAKYVHGSCSLECKMGGRHFVQWLEKFDLFVVPLDDQGHWFRYHHLFQKLLQSRLYDRISEEDISALYRRASHWFAENNLIDEAIHYALAAGDTFGAAQLVEQNRHTALNEDKWHILERWLAYLPDDIVQQRPELLLAKAWVLKHQFALWAIPPLLEAINTLLDTGEGEFPREEIDLFNGILLFWEGQIARCIELFSRVLERTPTEKIGMRSEAEIFLAVCSQMAGQGKTVVKKYWRKFSIETSEDIYKLRLLGSLVFIHLLSGELAQAEEEARRLHDMATRTSNIYIEAWSVYMMGVIHYQWNDLATASHYLSMAVENRFILDVYSDIDSYAGLILSYQGMQQPDKANEMMNSLMEFAQESNNSDYLPRARSVQARLHLLQGDLESAVRWLETTDFSFDTGTTIFWLEVPRITQCRVLIAMESEASLCEAAEKLRKHWKFAEANHNTPQMIEILLLQAMASHKQGDIDEAMAFLGDAVTQAWPGGYIRPFVDLDSGATDLLKHLPEHSSAAGFVSRILAACDENECISDQDESSIKTKQQPLVRNKALDNPLTRRELEILSFLGQGLRNKEVAGKLFMSPETIKKHTVNIYRKLDSHSRQDAVVKAYGLGIIR